MSLVVRLGKRNILLSVLEMAAFFSLVSAVYILATAIICLSVGRVLRWVEINPFYDMGQWLGALAGVVKNPVHPLGDIAAWFAGMQGWMYAVEGIGYFLLVTIYWAPGREDQNDAEVAAFTLFLVLAVLAAGALAEWRYGAVSWLVRAIVQAVTGYAPQ